MEIRDNLTTEECKEIIKNVHDVKDFLKTVIVDEGIGLSFHPNNNFEDYARLNGKGCYTPQGAIVRNNLLDKAFVVCKENKTSIGQVTLDFIDDNFDRYFR